MKTFRPLAMLCIAASVFVGTAAQSAPITSMTVFGDSLSDTGNVFIATGGAIPQPPYFNGRFSDGPIWIDLLAAGLGLPSGAQPVLGGGNNYAFGGARTGLAPAAVPGILAQVAGMWAPVHAAADPTGLYVVVGGGNDMRDARGAASTNATREAAAQAAATNIFNSVALLASRGATKVMISTLPDLGATPEADRLGLIDNSADATTKYNTAVAGLEALLESLFSSLDVILLDMFGLGQAVLADPAAFGITNVTKACGNFQYSLGADCSESMFSDELQPSAVPPAILGQAALKLVPLPATAALVLLGIALLGAQRRRQA